MADRMQKNQFQHAAELSDVMTDKWYEPVERCMFVNAIVSPRRAAMFIAQLGHESAGFVHTSEIWGPTPAQRRYDQRDDLGNTLPQAVAIARAHGSTPGSWWRGHGLIQVTGFYNHEACGKALGLDLLNDPKLITLPQGAVDSAAWFWMSRKLNELSDTGNVEAVTRKINGGINGLEDRVRRYNNAMKFLA